MDNRAHVPDVDGIPIVSLRDLVERHLGARVVDGPLPTASLEEDRIRERRLRRWLPASIVRRIDRGYARSNTVHPDTALALYTIARALRPGAIVETGTYWGYTASIFAAAVRDAEYGVVHSFDTYDEAGAHIPESLRPWVHLHRGRPAVAALPELLRDVTPGLFFQDSVHDYQGVLGELRVVVPALGPEALVLLHDFCVPEVRRAALDGLPGYSLMRLDNADEQQLAVALPFARR